MFGLKIGMVKGNNMLKRLWCRIFHRLQWEWMGYIKAPPPMNSYWAGWYCNICHEEHLYKSGPWGAGVQDN